MRIVGALGVVGLRALHGIARVAEVHEFRALHDAAIGDVQTGNDALC